MDMDHFIILPIYKQQVIFIHFHFHILDADGLRDFIIFLSHYNLVQEGMQSKERYFIPPNQSFDDIPTDIQHLYIYELQEDELDNMIFLDNSFYQLKSITIGKYCIKNVSEFTLDGLYSLKNVKIGEYCFSINNKKCNEKSE